MSGGAAESEARPTKGGVLAAVRRRRAAIAVCVILVPALALAISLHQQYQYSATATLYFQDTNYAQGLFGTSATFSPADSVNDPTIEEATNLSLVEQPIVAAQTAQALGKGFTRATIARYTSIAAEGQSFLVNITATTPNANLSANVANTYAAQFVSYRRTADSSAILAAEAQIAQRLKSMSAAQQNAPAGRELATREQDLAIYASLQTGNAQISQPATVPTGPSAPRPLRNTVIGLFAGIILGIALALLLERLDRTVRDVDELEHIFDRPILGTIQRSRRLATQRQAHTRRLTGPEMEAFRTLRANLRYLNVDREIRSVIINSAAPGEGKSTVSWNLAVVAASAGQSVLLIEADLRRPVFGELLGQAPGTAGLSDVLTGQREWRDVLDTVRLDLGAPLGDGEDVPTMDVISSGPLPPNPADLLESSRAESLLEAVRAEYDLVVIDSPPTSVVSDALHLFRHVDGVIVVTRVGATRRDLARQFSVQLARLGAPVLGVVVNGTTLHREYGGYAYDYQSAPSVPAVVGSQNGDGRLSSVEGHPVPQSPPS